MDLTADLMEEEDIIGSEEKGLTEITVKLEGMEVKALINMGSEVSVISETHWRMLEKLNKNIPTLPVAGVTIVETTGVRSKRVTTQIQLNTEIEGVAFQNTLLGVKYLKLGIMVGDGFLKRYDAVIDFRNMVLELVSPAGTMRVGV